MRAREVLVHAVDLNAGTGFGDLPRDFLAALVTDIVAKRREPALLLSPTDDDRTWQTGDGDPVPVLVRGPLAELTAYLAGRPFRDVEPAPALPPWL
jgi:maleylpyruvate isomerase